MMIVSLSMLHDDVHIILHRESSIYVDQSANYYFSRLRIGWRLKNGAKKSTMAARKCVLSQLTYVDKYLYRSRASARGCVGVYFFYCCNVGPALPRRIFFSLPLNNLSRAGGVCIKNLAYFFIESGRNAKLKNS